METVTTDTVNIIEAVKRSANDDAEDAVQANSSKRLKIMVDEDVSGEMAEEVPVVKDVEVSEEVTEVTERVVEAAEDSVAEPAGEAAGEDASEEEDEEFGGAAQQGVIDLSNVSPVVHFTTSPVITLVVGKEPEVKFGVHKTLLEHCNPFFEAMFRSGMREAQTHVVSLPEESPEVIKKFADWLYRAEVDTVDDDDEVGVALDCWKLGDKWQMPIWQDYLLNAMAAYWEQHVVDILRVRWAIKECSYELLSNFIRDTFKRTLKRYVHHYKEDGVLDSFISEGYMSFTQVLIAVKHGAGPRDHSIPRLCQYHLHPRSVTGWCPHA